MSLERRQAAVSSSPWRLTTALDRDWQVAAAPAGLYDSPVALRNGALQWMNTLVPATAASSLRAASLWSLDDPPRRFDAEDWWYRCSFGVADARDREKRVLKLEGLATLATVWLNGEVVLHSRNMFRSHEIDIGTRLRAENELVICCHSLDAALKARRPRPRWKAPMIENQQLRWFRTTVLGRTPGWSPPAAAVGPWRPITLEAQRWVAVEGIALESSLVEGRGMVTLRCSLTALDDQVELVGAVLRVRRDVDEHRADVVRGPDGWGARMIVEHPQLWWPHTHGEPALYEMELSLRVLVDGEARELSIDLGNTGFRSLSVATADDGFAVACNGIPVFCRGACWMPPDPVTLNASDEEIERTLGLVRAAGMNMIRISGATVYENGAVFAACDRMGILVWQDLMFANMDYPDAEEFVADCTVEIRQQLTSLAAHPCLAVICGNSEVEQQAAMFGAGRELWQPPLFHEVIAGVVREVCPTVPYWPSSAHGGAFPHQGNAGTTSYYGVGAYLRPLDDARRSSVRFATECLAFANVPEDSCLEGLPSAGSIKVHHPIWKARVPRDLGAGWDFEDVRDHYLKSWFGVDPLQLRYSQHDRYLALSRVVSGEVMAATFVDWRRRDSSCRGGLIWFLRDLWGGAGWGILDASGAPKAAYYFLRRVLQPLMIGMTDEGGNGLSLHIANDTATEFDGTVTVTGYRDGALPVETAKHEVQVGPRESSEIPVAALLPHFSDLNHAYRFGPPTCDLVVATLHDRSGAIVGSCFQHPLGVRAAVQSDLGLAAEIELDAAGVTELVVSTRRFAYAVAISVEHCDIDDQYFHLEPSGSRRIRLQPRLSGKKLFGSVAAINGSAAARFELSA